MRIMPISSVNSVNRTKTTTPLKSNDAIKPTFKGYSATIVGNLDKKMRNWLDAVCLFDKLLKEAQKLANGGTKRYLDVLTSDRQCFEDKLKCVKRCYEGSSETILSCFGKPILEATLGGVRFNGPNVGYRNVESSIFFAFKDDCCMVETNDLLMEFHDNGELKRITKYSPDYRSSETTYYNPDGTENNFRNFFAFFGL